MADTKISGLTDGTPCLTTDVIPVVRAGANFKVPANNVGGLNALLLPAVVTPPTVAGFTWGNQNTATAVANAGGALFVEELNSTGSDKIEILYKAVPGQPWAAILGYLPSIYSGNWNVAGMYMRENATGKIVSFTQGAGTSGTAEQRVDKYNSYTSLNGNFWTFPALHFGPIIWLKISYDGTNYHFWYSVDGQSWGGQMGSMGTTAFFTTAADQIGFGINPINGGGALFVHWSGI
jgi:hypothetical protein